MRLKARLEKQEGFVRSSDKEKSFPKQRKLLNRLKIKKL